MGFLDSLEGDVFITFRAGNEQNSNFAKISATLILMCIFFKFFIDFWLYYHDANSTFLAQVESLGIY